MKYRIVLNATGSVLTLLGVSMVFPLICGLLYQEKVIVAFLFSIIITVASGLCLRKLFPSQEAIGPKEGFAIATLGWISAAGFGTLPFLFAGT
ncbi:TrkH family potassium uptake protein, partial [Candidatus Aerophobetes bacterium]